MSDATDAGSRTFELPEALDFTAAAPLADQLSNLVGEDLVIDASAVQRLCGSCLQVLIGAARTWKAEGGSLTLQNPSARFVEDLKLLGLEPETLMPGGASS